MPSSEAWINYYLAARYAQVSKDALNKIAADLANKSPNSFESDVIQSMQLGYVDEAMSLLNRAYQSNPNHPATYANLVLLSEFMLDNDKRKEFSKLLWESSQVSSSLLSYSYNVLMSVDDKAVLFTEGDNTTLPIFILQDIFNVRKDVQVLNLDMMLESRYREQKLKLIGLDLNNFSSIFKETDAKKNLCGLLPAQNVSRKFYYSLTLGKQNIIDIKEQLYVVGLASQLSTQRMDNIASLKQNLENRFLLDYLTVDFDGEQPNATGKVFGANYLVPMLLLAEHYQKIGDGEKLLKWEFLIRTLAEQHGKTTVVENFLKDKSGDPETFVVAYQSVKPLEGSMRLIKGNIYAMKNEITIDDYNFFLKNLHDSKRDDLYALYNVDLSQYEEPSLTFMKGYHAKKLTKKERAGYPIINIPFEGAEFYCEWLTDQYNRNNNRKYKKVKFRLPSINEWQIAALGYKKFQSWKIEENTIEIAVPKNDTDELCKNCPVKSFTFKESEILYPWFGSFNYRNRALNKRGCSLGNFKWPDNFKTCLPTIPSADGWTAMSPVESYFPNGMGLYDVVGNVAEMTNEKGKACGGSWNHSPEESTITTINEYSGPDSAIGFRIFMEVIEE
jgi:formylglycine-generating enzyme required for sulfatase activity